MVERDDRTVGVVVVAAGGGTRLGASTSKALIEVAGIPLVVHAVRSLASAGLPPPVVVHPPNDGPAVARALADERIAALVPGGASRTDSVRRGVSALAGGSGLVAIHDAARPLVPVEVVHRVLAAVGNDVRAAAPGLPVSDTLKRVADGSVLTTVDREGLVGVQTPQVFPRDVLDAVLAADDQATDELTLVERWVETGRLAGRVVVVRGSVFAHKVTYPDDLELIAALARMTRQVAP